MTAPDKPIRDDELVRQALDTLADLSEPLIKKLRYAAHMALNRILADRQAVRNEVLAEVKKFLDCHCEQEHFKQGCGASTCPRWCANRIDNIKSSADKG